MWKELRYSDCFASFLIALLYQIKDVFCSHFPLFVRSFLTSIPSNIQRNNSVADLDPRAKTSSVVPVWKSADVLAAIRGTVGLCFWEDAGTAGRETAMLYCVWYPTIRHLAVPPSVPINVPHSAASQQRACLYLLKPWFDQVGVYNSMDVFYLSQEIFFAHFTSTSGRLGIGLLATGLLLPRPGLTLVWVWPSAFLCCTNTGLLLKRGRTAPYKVRKHKNWFHSKDGKKAQTFLLILQIKGKNVWITCLIQLNMFVNKQLTAINKPWSSKTWKKQVKWYHTFIIELIETQCNCVQPHNMFTQWEVFFFKFIFETLWVFSSLPLLQYWL